MMRDEYISQQESALADVEAITKRLKAGTISASEAEREIAMMMAKAERDSALHMEATRTTHAASRRRLLLLAVVSVLAACLALSLQVLGG